MTNLFHRYKFLIIGFLIGIILIYLWLKAIDLKQVVAYLHHINIYFILISLLCYLTAYFLRSLRWRKILWAIEPTTKGEIYALFMSGMMINYLLPLRVGEFSKGYFLKISRQLPMSKSLPTILIDKTFDLFPIVILFILIPFLPRHLHPDILHLLNMIFIAFLIILILIAVCIFQKNWSRKILNLFSFCLPRNKIQKIINNFLEGIHTINNLKILLYALFFTVLALFMDVLYIITMFKAFGQTTDFISMLFGYTVFNLSFIFPTPPAQIGSTEAINLLIFNLFLGLNRNLVAACLGFAHLLTGLLIFIIGWGSLLYLNITIKTAFSFKDYYGQ